MGGQVRSIYGLVVAAVAATAPAGAQSVQYRSASGVEYRAQRDTGPIARAESAFFLHDVGVVLLSKAVKLSAGQYGKLPTQDQLDALDHGSATTFTAVGYGLQEINPVHIESQRIRMFAEPHLIQINGGIVGDFSLLLSNNASTGGTCFGDSGGPNYLGTSNVIAGVTSFGLNGTCGGTGGVFRMDRKNVLDFVGQYLK